MKKVVLILLGSLLFGCNSTSNQSKLNFCERNGEGITRETSSPLVRIEPKYPKEAYENNIAGQVTLSFRVDKNGDTKDIRVISSTPEQVFDKVGTEAVRKWKYLPSCLNGVVQNTQLETTLTFGK
ncbi:energy transducer TonB [Glaciecola sp. MH2013]|uniref:energy transducer TonB n=1 Tax=Glaciecola sp. MH2013 TaxID=2785524 RepID=UPI00189D1332|nr:energy transducer TonB [Glaciecola sp. MH2013]MBF7074571.1 energy transducer TonB [Glaciecola sp. MH2013]